MEINKTLYEFLQKSNIIDNATLDQALEQANHEDLSLEHLLVAHDLIDDTTLGRIIADQYGMPFVRLSQISIPSDVLHVIPEEFARQHRVLAFAKNNQGLHIAMTQPMSNKTVGLLVAKKTGLPIRPYYATERDLEQALSHYITDMFTKLEQAVERDDKGTGSNVVVELVNTLLHYAHLSKASDIHIEPNELGAQIRFRVDGVMHDILQIPAGTYDHITTRIKVMANLRLDEHRSPQDGNIAYRADNDQVDIRVSIVPTTSGENIVMRLLSEKGRKFSLLELGLSQQNLLKVENAYRRSQGAIIASGPTGSGKTTTMYAILKPLNKPNVSIMTIEDPVEYRVERVRQIQVNSQAGLTFASGLKSILRQDPNIILVGEIRDQETANIATNAALTGHLVLSTLHTSDAATALPRLVDIGIESYLVASSVSTIIAQRLVRTICHNCRASHKITDEEREQLKQYLGLDSLHVNSYQGKGCPVCFNTGYLGRTGVFEVLEVNKEIQHAITNKENVSTIRDIAIASGMKTMVQDGIDKIKQGITTIEEVIGVARG